jgi:hypothetical protein
MKNRWSGILGTVLILLFLPFPLYAQSWEFAKEKDGIRIYTRKETGKSLKSFKGEATIHAASEQIFSMLENVNNTDWWDKNLTDIKVIAYEKYKSARYYLVYDLPWPVGDRDLAVDVVSEYDPATGIGKVTAVPLKGGYPEKEDKVRIREYRQTWTVTPVGNGASHVILEGFVDPSGHIPDWIINSVVVDSPLKVIRNVKERMEGR